MSTDRNVVGDCLIFVDETDCRIIEPSPNRLRRFSHKFHCMKTRHEVGIIIDMMNIVWVHGPFSFETWYDKKILSCRLASVLSVNEKVVEDGGYWHYK